MISLSVWLIVVAIGLLRDQVVALGEVSSSSGCAPSSIDDRARSALVPDLVMQPLVENAVRHGVTRRAEGGTISISARIVDGSLELAVQDDGAGMLRDESGREGLGLSNTRERLRAMYGDAASVTIVSPSGGGTKVLLKIPIQR